MFGILLFISNEAQPAQVSPLPETLIKLYSICFLTKNETNSLKTGLSRIVLPTRFELISMVPETIILSIELRELAAANIENENLVFSKSNLIFAWLTGEVKGNQKA